MENALTRKLERLSLLSSEDKALLASAMDQAYTVGSRKDIIREGDVPSNVHLIMSGIACRQKILQNGMRQIIGYLLPGDFCDLHVFILDKMDHTISTITSCTVVDIPRETILRLTERPDIARALWWATLVDEGTLREGLVNIGRRNADKRMAHFLCEMWARLENIGLVTDGHFELPLTQHELADTLGLSTVHVNRVLQQLRRSELVLINRSGATIPDVQALKAFCGFDSNYLHLGHHRAKREPSSPDVSQAL